VIQSEVGEDVNSFQAGLESAYRFEPNLIYVGDVRPGDEIPNLLHAVAAGITTLVSSASVPGNVLLEQFTPPGLAAGDETSGPIRTVIRVTPEEGGRLAIERDD